jgi:hypothetical protein
VFVVDSPTLVLAGLSNRTGRPGAILALVDCAASGLVKISCYILFARIIRNSLLVGKLVDSSWIASLAGSSSSAVDNNLGAKRYRGRVVVSKEDVESI